MVTLLQLPVVAGLAMTGLVFVPPNRATSGEPYWASLPNVRWVTPGIKLPKFHTHAPFGEPVPVVTSQRISEAGTLDSNWICGYRCPDRSNGPIYLNAVGWFGLPFGQV